MPSFSSPDKRKDRVISYNNPFHIPFSSYRLLSTVQLFHIILYI